MKPESKALLAVCVLATVAHLPGLWAGFALDDHMLLTRNPYLRSWSELGRLLTSEFFLASGEPRNVPYYRPLSGALYFLSYQAFGASAPLQHALNLGLHCCLTGSFYVILRRSGLGLRIAALFAALFAVHPATPDIVVYIGGRQDMLGWLFLISGGLFLGQARRHGALLMLVAALTVAAAALCREFFLASPPLLALLFLATGRGRKVGPTPYRAALSILAGGALGVAAVLALRRLLQIQPFALEGVTPAAIAQGAASLTLRLLQVAVLPFDVSVDVTPPLVGGALAVLVLTGLLSLAVASVVGVHRWGGNPYLALFGWGAFGATVLLHVPVLLKYDTASDRYAYGAILGLASVSAALVGPRMAQVQAVLRPSLLRPLSVGIVLALLPLTWTRASEWRDELSLQLAMYRNRPHDPEAQLAEGMRLFFVGDLDGAYPLCLAYSRAKPRSDRAGLCLGTALLLRGEAKAAVQQLEPFAYGRPGQLDARVRLFQAWFQAGDLASVERGIAYFGRMWPDAADVVAAREELERLRTPH